MNQTERFYKINHMISDSRLVTYPQLLDALEVSRATSNDRMLRRWLNDPQFDPVFRDWHKHDANWSWW